MIKVIIMLMEEKKEGKKNLNDVIYNNHFLIIFYNVIKC